MRLVAGPVLVAALLATSATTAHAQAHPAPAAPRFEVLDHGDSVEVIGHDITTARATIIAARSRLEIPLPPGAMPVVKRVVPGDATVLLAEIDPDAHAVSVKLTLDHLGTVALARASQAMQLGNDIHVLVPRKPEGVTLPEPTLPVVVEPEAKPAVEPAAKPEPKPEARPAKPDTTAAAALAPERARDTQDTKAEPSPSLASSLADEPGVNTSVLVGGALLAIAAAVWLWKRRKRAPAPVPVIDVVAQRALGGKARIVWLALGGREVIVAITPQQVSLLGAWPRGEAQAAPIAPVLPVATAASTGSGPIVVPQLPSLPRTITQNSPAITGILKLRERTAPPLADDIASGDVEADATWSRELLAATIAAHR